MSRMRNRGKLDDAPPRSGKLQSLSGFRLLFQQYTYISSKNVVMGLLCAWPVEFSCDASTVQCRNVPQRTYTREE